MVRVQAHSGGSPGGIEFAANFQWSGVGGFAVASGKVGKAPEHSWLAIHVRLAAQEFQMTFLESQW